QRQQYERANISYQAALALEPNSPEIYNGLGELLFAMGYLDRAVAAWRQAIALDPGYGEALTNLGNALGSGRRLP
ncbi:tetratricopeptide repeat protein, partial [Geitlerinema sp. P-1104]|uniref:tetratricopeptide repeat protein n=1 Tax=Geitlerinema sp. P-1104 TaxID=2546230 RepID=UPI001476952B